MLRRHCFVGLAAGALVGVFWASRPSWTAEMRLWKTFGDAALILLLVTLVIGPMAKLFGGWGRFLPWRRETGVWFGLMALVHGVLILNGWARWSLERFFGYDFVPQLERTARLEPGFGLANLMGVVALFWALVLTATSSDRATRALGPSAWKWLHSSTYVIFYLSLLHTAYFLFLHFTLSFHKRVPAPDWFRIPFVILSVAVIALQMVAFVKMSRAERTKRDDDRRTRSRGRTAART